MAEGIDDKDRMPTVSGIDGQWSEDQTHPWPEIEGYEIVRELGRGGMGTVYEAIQLGTERPVALKILAASAFSTSNSQDRFEREVRLAARLDHRNIARIYDSGLDRGIYYYVMRLVEGVPLDQYVRDNKLSQPEILTLMSTVCLAVQHAHQRRVIHRDLKPSNILVSQDGQPHVLDFGLAKSLHDDDSNLTVSKEGQTAGSPAYMSPEQAAGHFDHITTPGDVYSLGVILYELLTGESPHDLTGTYYEVLRRIAEDDVVRPQEADKRIDRELEALLLKALDRDSEARYVSAGDLAADIKNYLSNEMLTAKPPTMAYFLWKRLRKYRLGVAVAAAILIAMIGVAVFAYVRIAQERDVARRRLYISDMRLAQQAWEAGDSPRVLELLEGQHPQRTGGVDLRGFEWHYWWRLRHSELPPLKVLHGSGVTSIAFSHDGKRLASASGDGTVKIWDAATGKEVLTLKGHAADVNSVAFSPDGKRLASASGDGTVIIWDAATGEEVLTFKGHTGGVLSVAFSPDGKRPAGDVPGGRLASVSSDKTVKIWDPVTGWEVLTLKGHTDDVHSVAFSPDGKRLASASVDKTVRVWDAATGKALLALKGHAAAVISVAFSPDGKRLASASVDKTVKIWDAATGKALLTLKGHRSYVNSVAFSSDGRRLASAGDNTVKVWDVATGQVVLTLKGHTDGVLSLAFSPDGRRLASAGADGTVKIWDASEPAGGKSNPPTKSTTAPTKPAAAGLTK